MEYRFSLQHVGSIVDHTANIECVIQSIEIIDGVYKMITLYSLPADQLEHLQEFTDIEEII